MTSPHLAAASFVSRRDIRATLISPAYLTCPAGHGFAPSAFFALLCRQVKVGNLPIITKSNERCRMNLRQMEAFKTLMLAGSVTAAAELLRLSQPTISKLIAQLESQTQLRLFERRRRR